MTTTYRLRALLPMIFLGNLFFPCTLQALTATAVAGKPKFDSIGMRREDLSYRFTDNTYTYFKASGFRLSYSIAYEDEPHIDSCTIPVHLQDVVLSPNKRVPHASVELVPLNCTMCRRPESIPTSRSYISTLRGGFGVYETLKTAFNIQLECGSRQKKFLHSYNVAGHFGAAGTFRYMATKAVTWFGGPHLRFAPLPVVQGFVPPTNLTPHLAAGQGRLGGEGKKLFAGSSVSNHLGIHGGCSIFQSITIYGFFRLAVFGERVAFQPEPEVDLRLHHHTDNASASNNYAFADTSASSKFGAALLLWQLANRNVSVSGAPKMWSPLVAGVIKAAQWLLLELKVEWNTDSKGMCNRFRDINWESVRTFKSQLYGFRWIISAAPVRFFNLSFSMDSFGHKYDQDGSNQTAMSRLCQILFRGSLSAKIDWKYRSDLSAYDQAAKLGHRQVGLGKELGSRLELLDFLDLHRAYYTLMEWCE